MIPVYDLEGIERIERGIEDQHVVIFLIVKPSDDNADQFLRHLNYWHNLAGKYCNIYLLGYSTNFSEGYSDVVKVEAVNNTQWEYSDTCFIGVCEKLERRLANWQYSGTPELIVLQNKPSSREPLDFSYYNYIDINYGIEHEYIDSVPRFMQRLIRACKSEVKAKSAVSKADWNKLKPRNVLEMAIDECEKLPKPVRKIINDKLFYKTYKTKNR